MEYLGILVSTLRVTSGQSKIAAMVQWPAPQHIKQLQGFSGLTGYYLRFIKKKYASTPHPLTALLKNDAFLWNNRAEEDFEELKIAMSGSHSTNASRFLQNLLLTQNDASWKRCTIQYPIILRHFAQNNKARHQCKGASGYYFVYLETRHYWFNHLINVII